MKDCLFCKIAEGEIPSDIVYEDNEVVAFKDINPQAPVHVLIIPKKHIAKIADISSDDQLLIGKLIFTANNLGREMGISEDGYRLVFNNGKNAGQEVYHIHLHLLGGRSMQWPPG
ncbi:MAG: histidine triad nucleotide-binding protein [Calditrichia bacterium]|nr:histidine triad nucleotide-binding protein [Calditrichia bacterium]